MKGFLSNEYFSIVGNYFRSPEYNENLLTAKLNWSKTSDKKDDDSDDVTIPGGELYFRIKKFFKDHLEKIAQVNNYNNIVSNKY